MRSWARRSKPTTPENKDKTRSLAGLVHFRRPDDPTTPKTLTTRREARRPGNHILPPRQSPAPGRGSLGRGSPRPRKSTARCGVASNTLLSPNILPPPTTPAGLTTRQSPAPQPRQSPPLRQSHPASPGGAYYKSVSIPGETSEQNPPIRPILYHLVQFSGILDQKVWAEGIVFLLLPRFCMPGGMPSINQTNSL